MDSGPYGSPEGGSLMNEQEPHGADATFGAGRASSRRRWFWALGGLWFFGAALVFFLHGFLLDTIVAQAERRGVLLSACRLDLGGSPLAWRGARLQRVPTVVCSAR